MGGALNRAWGGEPAEARGSQGAPPPVAPVNIQHATPNSLYPISGTLHPRCNREAFGGMAR